MQSKEIAREILIGMSFSRKMVVLLSKGVPAHMENGSEKTGQGPFESYSLATIGMTDTYNVPAKLGLVLLHHRVFSGGRRYG